MESDLTIGAGRPHVKPAVDLRQLPTLSRPGERQAEAIRGLCTQVIARHVRRGHRALAICGATPDVGCTFVASNLAAALSQTGIRTLLIDGDLRGARCDQIFRRPRITGGLQQFLMTSGGHPNEFIESDVLPNLSILFAGGLTPDSQELLASERYLRLMDFCCREFDATIIDTPPVSESSDALRICNVVSYSVIVARRNRTLVHDVKVLAQQLDSAGARIIGTVLIDD
jgi:protein-tyrosine kinase